MVLGPESREGDRVFDVDGVVFGSRNERSVRVFERQLVQFDRTPGHDLADEDPRLPIALDAFPGQRAVTFRLARDFAADASARGDVDQTGRILPAADDF